MILALAVAWVAIPVLAAEGERSTTPAEKRPELAVPVRGIPPISVDFERLQRLRLHPGQDAFDPRETVRGHPERTN